MRAFFSQKIAFGGEREKRGLRRLLPSAINVCSQLQQFSHVNRYQENIIFFKKTMEIILDFMRQTKLRVSVRFRKGLFFYLLH